MKCKVTQAGRMTDFTDFTQQSCLCLFFIQITDRGELSFSFRHQKKVHQLSEDLNMKLVNPSANCYHPYPSDHNFSMSYQHLILRIDQRLCLLMCGNLMPRLTVSHRQYKSYRFCAYSICFPMTHVSVSTLNSNMKLGWHFIILGCARS